MHSVIGQTALFDVEAGGIDRTIGTVQRGRKRFGLEQVGAYRLGPRAI